MKVLVSSRQWSFWNLFFIIGSIASFFLFFGVLSAIPGYDPLYGVFDELWRMPESYMLLFFTCVAYLLVDIGIGAINEEMTNIRQMRLEMDD